MIGTVNIERISSEALTAEEFFVWWNQHPDEDAKFELDGGSVFEKTSFGSQLHGVVCALVLHRLTDYILRARCGGYMLANNPGCVLDRSPDTVLCPDAMLYLEPPPKRLTNFFATDLPTLAVEVSDTNDDRTLNRERADRMIAAGIPMVWVLDPKDRNVMVHSQTGPSKTLDETDELTGESILPGFACKVGDFFAWPTQPSATSRD